MNGSKVVLVTGGSSGIGKEVVKALRERGCTVYSISRHQESGEYGICCDVSDEAKVNLCVGQVADREGKVDVLVNCAGFGISGACEFTNNTDAHRQLEVNLFGTVNMIRAVIPYMRDAGGGRIVNVSSVAAVVPIPFQAWYSISKAAVNTYTMAIANELKPFNISLCAVMPGDTKTGFTDARNESTVGDDIYCHAISKSVEKMKHDERKGVSPEKVAGLIVKTALKKRVKPMYTCGFDYKMAVLLIKLLPAGLANKIIGILYA